MKIKIGLFIIAFTLNMILFLFLYTHFVQASTWSRAATISKIQLVRHEGFLFYGAFGNPRSCTDDTAWFVPADHPQYDKLYALALTAMASQKKVQAYSHKCTTLDYYGTNNQQKQSLNTIINWGFLEIQH